MDQYKRDECAIDFADTMSRSVHVSALALVLLFALDAAAQTYSIQTFAGPPLPVHGAPAIGQNLIHPNAVASDNEGGFYFSSYDNRVYRVTAQGTLLIVAGDGSYGFGGDGGPAIAA